MHAIVNYCTLLSFSSFNHVPVPDGGPVMTQLPQEVDGLAGKYNLLGLLHCEERRHHGLSQAVLVMPETVILYRWVACHKEL